MRPHFVSKKLLHHNATLCNIKCEGDEMDAETSKVIELPRASKMVRIPRPVAEQIEWMRGEFIRKHGVNVSFNAMTLMIIKEGIELRSKSDDG